MQSSYSSSPGRRQQQASAYATGDSSHAAAASTSSSAELYRSLVFGGSVPLCISLLPEELPAGSDRSIDSVYLQVPRISYLPLIIPEIRKNLLDLVLDDNAAALLKESNLWLECEGEPLKWHWPIGLIHDFLRTALQPLKLNLHLSNPPLDKLFMAPSIETCKANFMSQIKEADFVRWGSVRRITSLRKMDQDALWDGVITNDFHKFWTVAAKLVPSPSTAKGKGAAGSTSPMLTTTSTFDASRVPEANSMRSIPMRIYLPHGAPIIQDVVPAINASTGRPATFQSALTTLVPSLMRGGLANQKAPTIRVIVQGIELPLDTELGWCSACLSYPDGWLGVVIGL
ncbi:APG5-domain-containing protein [Cystobasidium minutum MCA 4210]|uniref:APG5-domain-containing protein n=1 Tax=Cystobasidium minutum MCA 4210 TaxID=1397322 RepID=UPI0034CE1291|eukprot:jgi/Rhomi1/139434/e_gw1.1.415.1